jgi:hypothetical protein
VLELHRIEFDARRAEQLLNKQPPVHIAQGETVGFCGAEDMVGGNQATCTGHIFYDYGRLAGDVFANVARDRSAIDVKSAARAKSDHEPQRFPSVKFLLRRNWRR